MDNTNHDADLEAERIAAPLRTAEHLPRDFEARLLSRIRAETLDAAARKKDRPRSWWTAPRTITRAPIVSFALAAGFAALVALTTIVAAKSGPIAGLFAAKTDTVHLVRFVFLDSTARHVAVVGDFNRWGASEIPLTMSTDGTWTATVALSGGSHEYAFVIDRQRWEADPSALSTRDEFGTPTSHVNLGAADFIATE